MMTVSEVIALKLRREDNSRVYLYPQIFSGLCYTIASFLMLYLWHLQRQKKKKKKKALSDSPSSSVGIE
jgi:hypothetical protein